MKKAILVILKRTLNTLTPSFVLKTILALILIFTMTFSCTEAIAISNEKYTIPTHVVITGTLYSNATHTSTFLPSSDITKIAFEAPLATKEDILIINTYAYGDAINTLDENTTQGIENVTVSIDKIRNCGAVVENQLKDKPFKYPNINIIRINENIDEGIYKITIKVTTIANEYSDIFFNTVNINNEISFYISIGETQTLQSHSTPASKITIFNVADDGSKNIINELASNSRSKYSAYTISRESFFSLDILDQTENSISGFYFYFDDKDEYSPKKCDMKESFNMPTSFETNSSHTLYYAFLYNDGCVSKFYKQPFIVE